MCNYNGQNLIKINVCIGSGCSVNGMAVFTVTEIWQLQWHGNNSGVKVTVAWQWHGSDSVSGMVVIV